MLHVLTSSQIILDLDILFRGHAKQRCNAVAVCVPVRAPPGNHAPWRGWFIVRHGDTWSAGSKLSNRGRRPDQQASTSTRSCQERKVPRNGYKKSQGGYFGALIVT
jgi:hypothetical protein